MTPVLDRGRFGRRGRRGTGIFRRRRWFLVFFTFLCSFTTVQWMLSFPAPLPSRHSQSPCAASTSADDCPYVLQEDAVCSTACGKQCFPRVRGLCISHDVVTVCEGGRRGTPMPSELRFAGSDQYRRRKVPVKAGTCGEHEGAKWVTGTQMIADMKMMPNSHRVGPNPHHEAEKIIPAILLSHFFGLNKSSLYWFTDPLPSVTSVWSVGMIAAFADEVDVKFSRLPEPGQPPICFEDAVVFSGVTNAGYIPNVATNDWLRKKVLDHCQIPEVNARRPVTDVVVVHRLNSSRTIENVDAVDTLLERELRVPVKHMTSGVGDFCEQARMIAEADFVLTPHGSHNINFVFARPGAVVLEAFPLLYYIDWFHNYVHAARLSHHELYGTWPTDRGGMPLRMRLFALLFGWRHCFSFRQCMNFAKNQRIFIDVDQLEWLLHTLTSSCRVAVNDSWCLSAGLQNTAVAL